MSDVKKSKRPGGIAAEITLTFASGSGVTTAVGSAVEAWAINVVDDVETAATTAEATAATTLYVEWPNETLDPGRYRIEAYMTPSGGAEDLVHESEVIVRARPGP